MILKWHHDKWYVMIRGIIDVLGIINGFKYILKFYFSFWYALKID